MDQDRTPQELAHAAADTVRELNIVSQSVSAFHGEDGFRGVAPANVAGAVDGLIVLLERLPQTFQQIRRALQQLEEEQQIRMANGADPGEEVAHAVANLQQAEGFIDAARGSLRAAASSMSAMGGYLDEVEYQGDDLSV